MAYMWKLAIGVIFVPVCIQAQAFQDLMLPQVRRITGVVVDEGGKPVADARIDHPNDRRRAHQTDSEGRFEVDTRAPILVIRKPGLQSALLRTQDATETRITLRSEEHTSEL